MTGLDPGDIEHHGGLEGTVMRLADDEVRVHVGDHLAAVVPMHNVASYLPEPPPPPPPVGFMTTVDHGDELRVKVQAAANIMPPPAVASLPATPEQLPGPAQALTRSERKRQRR